MAGEDGGRSSLGEFLFYVGQVGFEKGLAGGHRGVGAAKDPFVGIPQEPGILVGFTAHHHAVQVFQLLFYLVQCFNAAVQGDVQLGHLGFQLVDKFIFQRWDFTILLGREPLEPGLTGVYNEDTATRIGESPDKVPEKLPGIKLINADAAFDGDGDGNGILHGLEAVGHQVLVFHKAGAEVSVLHPVRWASAIQVHFVESGTLYQLTCLRKFVRIGATKLKNRWEFAVFVFQKNVRILAVYKPCGYHHLAV